MRTKSTALVALVVALVVGLAMSAAPNPALAEANSEVMVGLVGYRFAVVDAESGAVTSTQEEVNTPIHVHFSSDASKAYFVAPEGVDVRDGSALTVQSKLEMAMQGPQRVLLDSDAAKLYVFGYRFDDAMNRTREYVVVDLAADTVAAPVPFPEALNVDFPAAVAGSSVFAQGFETADSGALAPLPVVVEIGLGGGAVVGTSPIAAPEGWDGLKANSVAFADPSAGRILMLVSATRGGRPVVGLASFDLATRATSVTEVAGVDKLSWSFFEEGSVSPDGGTAYLFGGGYLVQVELASGTVKFEGDISTRSLLAVDDEYVYAASADSLVVLSADTMQSVRTVALPATALDGPFLK